MGDQHAFVEVRVGVDPDHELAGEVLGQVGDQPVLPDRDHEVAGLEQEAVELLARDLRAPPADRQGAQDGRLGRLEAGLARLEHVEALPPASEEELGLPARPVTREQGLELGRPGHDHDPGFRHGLGLQLAGRRPDQRREQRAEGLGAEVEVIDPGQVARQLLRR